MQRDYGAAQAAFEDFLNRYPKDSLAGNAQYWLGEAHFVRGEYKEAAGSFLKGYQNYAGNARAADSLLKLAMSLDRLGQKDAACSSFAELSTRFPDAPENVKIARQVGAPADRLSLRRPATRRRAPSSAAAPIARRARRALCAALSFPPADPRRLRRRRQHRDDASRRALGAGAAPSARRKLVVATVDHGLRRESREEAAVGRRARRARSGSRTRCSSGRAQSRRPASRMPRARRATGCWPSSAWRSRRSGAGGDRDRAHRGRPGRDVSDAARARQRARRARRA